MKQSIERKTRLSAIARNPKPDNPAYRIRVEVSDLLSARAKKRVDLLRDIENKRDQKSINDWWE